MDLVTITTASRMIVVTRGARAVTVNVSGGHDGQLARVRAMLLGSAAIDALRRLAVVLEESGTDAPEKMGIRFTAALVAQMDGDEGAVRRLSRELHARYSGQTRRPAPPRPDGGHTYRAGVLTAAEHLESALGSFYLHNPLRQVCSFLWLLQAESLWCAYVTGSPVRLH